MSVLRRVALGVLTVGLLAVAAVAAGYSMRESVADDGPRPGAVAFDEPAPGTVEEGSPAARPPVRTTKPRSQRHPLRTMEAGRVLLGPGANGLRVRHLQARLAQLDWYFGDVTGQYGDATTKAVRGFQGKRQIPVTGKVDRRTLDRLLAMTAKPTRSDLFNLGNIPGALDARCRIGRVLCIDKSSNTLRWVIDGKVQKTVDVRFGSSYTPTREGQFSVYYKSRNHVSELYDTAMPFAMFFSGGQAVHYSPDFAAVGYSGASHGCVNVRDYDVVAWLFEQVSIGDKVIVYWS